MPRSLLEVGVQQERRAWLSSLPGIVRNLSEAWSLNVGEPYQPGGETAWVAPVEDRCGRCLVLKIAWNHPEGAHEADGLRAWKGDGAVRLLACQELGESVALLLERCVPGTPLASRPEEEQDLIIADLLHRLWVKPAAGHRFRPLREMCEQWADGFETKESKLGTDLDVGIRRDAIALLRELPTTAEAEVLLVTDLHAGNVLAAQREPWLMIDPKPYLGDPSYDPLQHMLNCEGRLRADPRGLAYRMADLLDLNRDRILLWLFVRCVQESPDRPRLAEIARRIAPA